VARPLLLPIEADGEERVTVRDGIQKCDEETKLHPEKKKLRML
jgi:hypothetical protein